MSQNKHLNTASKMGDIISYSPISRQLSTSVKTIKLLTNAWNQWTSKNISQPLIAQCSLSHYIDGQLFISCQSAGIATKVKHQKESLLLFLQQTKQKKTNTNYPDITQITIFVSPSVVNSTTHTSIKSNSKKEATSNEQVLRSLESCKNTISSKALSDSLAKLKKTLSKP